MAGRCTGATWRGTREAPGPATVWARPRLPLVADEPTAPEEDVLLVCDSASGVSAVLDWRRWSFVNVTLDVHLGRRPRAGWVCLDARTTMPGDGSGLCRADLHDEDGWLGRSAQALFVVPRT